jgi:hypothetical protein
MEMFLARYSGDEHRDTTLLGLTGKGVEVI